MVIFWLIASVFIISPTFAQNTGRESMYNNHIKVYVSPSGNDNANGNKNQPVKTIGKAIERVKEIASDASNYTDKAGIAVLFQSGNYKINEPVSLSPDITQYGELCFAGIEDNVILSGKERVSSKWKAYRDGIYRTNIGADKVFRELYVNNQLAVRARYPNTTEHPERDIVELNNYSRENGQVRFFFDLKENATDTQYFNKALTDQLTRDTGSVEMFMIQEWALSIGQIRAIDYVGNTVSFRLNADAETNLLNRDWPHIYSKQPHWLENSLALLDAENEWYYDKKDGYLYYKPTSGTNINTLKIEYPGATECLFAIQGSENNRVKNISFKNLIIEGSNWTLPSTQGYIEQHNGQYNTGNEQWMERPQSAILLEWAENITFEGNIIRNMASTAIDCYQGAKNIYMIGNAFGDIGGSAVSFGQRSEKRKGIIGKFTVYDPDNREEITQKIHIENNYFEACGRTYHGATTIAGGYSMEIFIRHNEVNGSAHDAVSMGWGHFTEKSVMRDIHIENNRLLNTKAYPLLYDGAGLYVLGTHDVTDVDANGKPLSTINGNYITYLGGACGLYFDSGTTNYSAKNNVVDGRKRTGPSGYNLGHIYINDMPQRPEWTILNIHVENTFCTDLTYTGPMDGGLKEYHNRLILKNVPDNGVQRTDRTITVKNSVLIADADWSSVPAAQDIVNVSGLEDVYKCIKDKYLSIKNK